MNASSRNIVVLINLPLQSFSYTDKGSIYPGTGLLLIGSLLKQNGYEVKLIDGCYYENYLELLHKYVCENCERIIFVGLSSMTPQIPFALKSAKIIRKIDPKIPIVMGGAHATLYPEQVIESEFIDIAVINEGTFSSLKLARTIKNNGDISSIKGIAYNNLDKSPVFSAPTDLEKINELPKLDFSLLQIDNYFQNNSVYRSEFPGFSGELRCAPILTALGCPYKCQFCINVILKRKYRYLSAEVIIETIQIYMENSNINTFVFMDEDFFISKKRMYNFLDLAEKENLHFNWRMWCRVDHFSENFINREILERFAKIGHGSLVMGGESANQNILDALQKGTKVEQIKYSLSLLSGLPITPRYSFMVGLEDESAKEIANTYRFTLELKDLSKKVNIAGPFIFRLYPGSPIFTRLVEKHSLHIPDKLEDWEAFLQQNEDNYTDYPWVPDEFLRNYRIISFYHEWALRNEKSSKSFFRYSLRKAVFLISRLRIKYFCFHFPLLYKIYNRLNIN